MSAKGAQNQEMQQIPLGGRLGVDPDLRKPPQWWGSTIHGQHHEMFTSFSGQGEDSGAAGLKNATIGWANGYYVTFALMMTVAFTALLSTPNPVAHATNVSTFDEYLHWRPDSAALDAIVQLLYAFFALAACYDSTWGTLLCAAWAVRAPCVPATVFERFLFRLTNLRKYRSEHCGVQVKTLLLSRRRFFGTVNAWDPFYFVDRNVLSLFMTGACFLYLQQGAVFAGIAIGFLLALRFRVNQTITATVDEALLGNGESNQRAHEVFGGMFEDIL